MSSRLPIVQPAPKIRPSRMSRRRALVLIGVHLLIAAHIAHWLLYGRTMTPLEPSEAMAFTKGDMVNAGLLFFAVAIVSTAVLGRFFCGWGCHLVALQDLCRRLLEAMGRKPKPLRSRLLRWVPAIAFLYMFLWPLAYRLWIRDSFGPLGTELTTEHFWATFPGWVIGGLTFLTCGFAIVYFLGAKGFCTYACPYGAVFGAVERLSPFRIRVTDACAGCGHCTAVCTSNVRVHEEVRDFGMVVDSGCMKCMDCVSVCPNDALYYGAGPIPWAAARRVASRARRSAHSWVEEGFLGLAFAAAFFTFRGLYGTLPFLFSLGLAGVLAYLALLGLKMVVRPQVALKGWRLKDHGSIRRAGWVFAAVLAVLTAVWGHSAWIRLHQLRGERAYAATLALRVAALDPSAAGGPVEGSAAVERAVRSLEAVRDDGLLPTPGLASRLAPLYLLQGRYSAARKAAGEAVERGEEPAVARRVLARLALATGDPVGAIREYEALLQEVPAAPRSWVDLGVVQARAGRLSVAETTFREGLARHPESADLAYNFGLARALAGDPEDAVESFARALELEPSHLAARENLAGVLASIGRFAEAADHYRLALARAPDDAETRLLLARVLAALGEGAAALAEVERSLRLAPELEEAIILRQQLLEIEARSSSSTSLP